jgi:sugar lactone lactonase YvrE
VFARFGDDEGRPDGAAIDAEGGYWIAHVLGGSISRFRPDGTRAQTIAMPVSRPTMCAFGGPDLGTLYVTSGREHLSPEELARQPKAGGVFALRPGVVGLPEPAFRGSCGSRAP